MPKRPPVPTLGPPTLRPCAECPFRRVAANGWLGGHPVDYFVAGALSDYGFACHRSLGNELEEPEGRAHRQCTGAAVFAANHCKSPRFGHRLPADDVNFFKSAEEFRRHHAELPSKKRHL